MSIPVSVCALIQAAQDEAVAKKMAPGMHRNLKGGHFTIIGCQHDPPCNFDLLTDEAAARLKELWLNWTPPPAE